MSDVIETIEYKGYGIEIHHDEHTPSPREDDNLGTLCLFHGKYNLPNESDMNSDELKDYIEKNCGPGGTIVYHSVRGYDHGGLAVSTSNAYPFNCQWDSGMLGYIFITKKKVIEEYGKWDDETRLKVHEYLNTEVEVFNDWLTGSVYLFDIKDDEEETIDSCGGFYGYDNEQSGLLDSAHEYIDSHINNLKKIGLTPELLDISPVKMAMRITEEVLADIKDGTVPNNVKTFGELGDHVDQNSYYDEFPDSEGQPDHEKIVERHCRKCNCAAEMVEVWLKWRLDQC